tara:strand:+ start:52 stop:441 length:390 start_codon:yes stop_codon:yes gene_type:complete
METKKELGITKGEWRFIQEEMKIKGSGDIEGMTVIANISPKMDYSRGMTTQCHNANLIADAGTTANKCNLLPSELLERYNEAIEALNDVVRIKNPYSKEKQYQQWAAVENILYNIIRSKKIQQTISKSK